jgi:hypothetical protein
MPYQFVLIDDDPDEHLIFSMAIAELPFYRQCTYYFRFQDALDAYTSHQQLAPDFIFLGCGIPTPETRHAIDKLVHEFRHTKTTVVLYSAYKNIEISSAEAIIFNCPFLPKLTSVAELADAMKNLVQNNPRSFLPDAGSSTDIGGIVGSMGGQA